MSTLLSTTAIAQNSKIGVKNNNSKIGVKKNSKIGVKKGFMHRLKIHYRNNDYNINFTGTVMICVKYFLSEQITARSR